MTDKTAISHAQTAALHVYDKLHLAYFDNDSTDYWQSEAHKAFARLADRMGYTITRQSDAHDASAQARIAMGEGV